MTATDAPPPEVAAVLTEEEQRIESLTLAIMRYYGYTDADIAAAAAVHPGRVCDEDTCYDEDGETIHPPAYNELGATASTVVEVVDLWLAPILATARTQAAEQALRDAADGLGGLDPSGAVAYWLRGRAEETQ